MKTKLLSLLTVLCLVFSMTAGAESGAFLSGNDLHEIQPEYEAFLESLSDLLVEKGLLAEAEREDWILYQLGDFLQNGGYGTISAMYTPGLLDMADASVSMRRFELDTPAGMLLLETLGRYSPNSSSLPGLPLDAGLRSHESGEPVSCRFRWTATDGMLMIWDGNDVVEVGSTYISDGRPLYWMAQPQEGASESLRLELLHADEDVKMGTVTLNVYFENNSWIPEAIQ